MKQPTPPTPLTYHDEKPDFWKQFNDCLFQDMMEEIEVIPQKDFQLRYYLTSV